MSASVAEPPTEEHELSLSPPPETAIRFARLADAVRRHRAIADHPAVPKRPADHALYRSLDELEH
jgi:hypothetical protein